MFIVVITIVKTCWFIKTNGHAICLKPSSYIVQIYLSTMTFRCFPFESSANNMMSTVAAQSGKSLMKAEKIMGPMDYPWTTPEVTSEGTDEAPWYHTTCCLPCRKLVIHASASSSIPSLHSLLNKIRRGTLSNACTKSNWMTPHGYFMFK